MDNIPHPAWHGDEHHGVGGSYTYDPKTGKRRLTERPESIEPAEPTGDATPEKE